LPLNRVMPAQLRTGLPQLVWWARHLSTTPDGEKGDAAAATDKDEPAGEDEARAGNGDSPEVAELKAQVVDLQEKLETKHDQLLRTAADMENIRKRSVVEVENAHKFAVQGFAKDVLDVADNMQRALDQVPVEVREGDENPQLRLLFEGVKLTDDILLKTFAKHGIHRMTPEGEKFDPNMHEALYEMPNPEAEPGTVARVESTGYMLHERCLRPAKVGVVAKR